jgi:hypothetical protein
MQIFFLIGSGVWLVILSWVVFQMQRHYHSLIKSTQKGKIDEILEALIKKDSEVEADLQQAKKEIHRFAEESKTHLQKIGLVRFNPFKMWRTDQSFVIAILNKDNSGLIINYIYTKEGLRVYTKRVKNGKGEEYELTEEEKKAIEKSHY